MFDPTHTIHDGVYLTLHKWHGGLQFYRDWVLSFVLLGSWEWLISNEGEVVSTLKNFIGEETAGRCI